MNENAQLTPNEVNALIENALAKRQPFIVDPAKVAFDAGRTQQEAFHGVNGQVLPKTRFVDWGGDSGEVSFPQRSYDPFVWSWDAATMTLTIGNVMLYNSSGVLLTHIPVDIVLAEGTTWINMTYVHDGGALDIGYNTTSLATASTSEADIEAGVQKIPLYAFTVTGTGCVCVGDYIHHGAVGTTFR